MLVGEVLAKKYNWKVGDRLPLQSQIFPNRDGSKNWNFTIDGIMSSKDNKAFQSQMILLHWKNFDDSTPYNRGNVGWYVTRVSDVNQADAHRQADRRAVGELRPRNADRRPSRRRWRTGSSSRSTSA